MRSKLTGYVKQTSLSHVNYGVHGHWVMVFADQCQSMQAFI